MQLASDWHVLRHFDVCDGRVVVVGCVLPLERECDVLLTSLVVQKVESKLVPLVKKARRRSFCESKDVVANFEQIRDI